MFFLSIVLFGLFQVVNSVLIDDYVNSINYRVDYSGDAVFSSEFREDFSLASGVETAPENWRSVDLHPLENAAYFQGANGVKWEFSNIGKRFSVNPLTPPFAIVDASLTGEDGFHQQKVLISPAIRTRCRTRVVLHFDTFFSSSPSQGFGLVQIQNVGETVRHTIARFPDSQVFGSFEYDITDSLTEDYQTETVKSFYVWFSFSGSEGWWIVDNVEIGCLVSTHCHSQCHSFCFPNLEETCVCSGIESSANCVPRTSVVPEVPICPRDVVLFDSLTHFAFQIPSSCIVDGMLPAVLLNSAQFDSISETGTFDRFRAVGTFGSLPTPEDFQYEASLNFDKLEFNFQSNFVAPSSNLFVVVSYNYHGNVEGDPVDFSTTARASFQPICCDMNVVDLSASEFESEINYENI